MSKAVLGVLEASHIREVAELRRENEWLRQELAAAYRHQRTVERVERKLPEREPEPRKPPEPVDEEVMFLLNLYPESARGDLISSVRAARQENPPLSWAEIAQGIKATMPAPLLTRLNGTGGE